VGLGPKPRALGRLDHGRGRPQAAAARRAGLPCELHPGRARRRLRARRPGRASCARRRPEVLVDARRRRRLGQEPDLRISACRHYPRRCLRLRSTISDAGSRRFGDSADRLVAGRGAIDLDRGPSGNAVPASPGDRATASGSRRRSIFREVQPRILSASQSGRKWLVAAHGDHEPGRATARPSSDHEPPSRRCDSPITPATTRPDIAPSARHDIAGR
jgi:hypothetical protein